MELCVVDAICVDRADGRIDIVPAVASACRSCGQCAAATRAAALARLPDARTVQFAVPSHSLLTACVVFYGAPLAGLLSGALAAMALRVGDFAAIVIALTGMFAAALLTRRAARVLEQRIDRELMHSQQSVSFGTDDPRTHAPAGLSG